MTNRTWGTVIHLVPKVGIGPMVCCGKTPWELPLTDRMTADPEWVTCPRYSRPIFTCGLRISCGRCPFAVCSNSSHRDYAEDPFEAMNIHKADAHREAR